MGRVIDVRINDGLAEAKVARGIAAINGKKALYRHFRSIQSSISPIKPPNKMHTAKVSAAETPLEVPPFNSTSKKYRRKM